MLFTGLSYPARAREKGSTKFPTKPLSDNYCFTGKYNGFIIYGDETTEDQMVNVAMHFKDTMEWTFKPITSAAKQIELYMKSKGIDTKIPFF